MSDTLLRPAPTVQRTGEGEHDVFAHYAPKDKIVESMVTGTPIRALCGKLWIPSRDPEKYPVCPTCVEIYAGLSD